MLVEPPTSKLQTKENKLLSLSSQQHFSPINVGLHGVAVMLSSRNQTILDTLFPDEEHSYEPRRQVRFAALSRNALPYSVFAPQRRRQSNSPVKRQKVPPPSIQQPNSIRIPTSPAVQAFRKKQENNRSPKGLDKESIKRQRPERPDREFDTVSRELWGFPVRYSPKKQLDTQWCAINEQNQRYFEAKQEQDTRPKNMVLHLQQESKTNKADYAQYLYLSNLYGPLDALLYCCCRPGSHGRVYMLLVENSARRLQRWVPKAVAALRRYWVGRLAREVSTILLAEGLEFVVHSFQHQRQATALFQRLRLLQAARALRAWHEYTTRMFQLRDKMHLALAKDLESRFFQWRANVQARKNFRLNVKHIARHKAMEYAFEKWRSWSTKHEKLRCHLMQRCLKTKQEHWMYWCDFVRCNQAAKALQRSWRLHAWRKQRDRSSRLIGRVYRGWKTRQRVRELRKKMDIHSVMLRMRNVVISKTQCDLLVERRAWLLERKLIRAREEADAVIRAENQAVVTVDVELSKVLRNDMHRKLEKHIDFIKQDAPLQVAKSIDLRRLALQLLIDEQQVLARRQVLEMIRTNYSDQDISGGNPCLICQAYFDCMKYEPLDKLKSFEHTCLSDCRISVSGKDYPLSAIHGWENNTRMELANLEQREREYTQKLLTTEPSICSIWRSITVPKKSSW